MRNCSLQNNKNNFKETDLFKNIFLHFNIFLIIFFNSIYNEISGKYYLTFRYDDIYGNEYIKKHELIISEDKGKSKLNVKPIIEHNYVNC